MAVIDKRPGFEKAYDIEEYFNSSKLPDKISKRELLNKKKEHIDYMVDQYEKGIETKPNGLIELSYTLAKIELNFMSELIDIMLIEE